MIGIAFSCVDNYVNMYIWIKSLKYRGKISPIANEPTVKVVSDNRSSLPKTSLLNILTLMQDNEATYSNEYTIKLKLI